MPLLVIIGDRDELLDSRATQRRLAVAAPHAEVELLLGAGHMLPDPTERIGEFLND